MLKIVFLDRITLPEVEFNFDFPFILEEYQQCQKDEILPAIIDADIVITKTTPLRADILKQARKLKLVAVCATGFDHIDIAEARKLGISVCNMKGYSTNTVAEHAFAMILSLMHNLNIYQSQLPQWQSSSFFSINTQIITELAGKTLAIVGRGDIGQKLAHFATAFDMQVLFLERKNATTVRDGYVAFEEGLKMTDVISLHCPKTMDNFHLIDEQDLQLMKKSSILINVSRGGLINEDALLQALINQTIAGAGLDVLEQEPPKNSSPLLNYQGHNLILTQHIAWKSDNSLQNTKQILENNINCFVQNKAINLVN
jgi:glycerate dehydrogenase